MRVTIIVLIMVAGLSKPAFGQEFYVEARRNAIVRDLPDRDSESRLRLERGDQLNTVTDEQTNRFYNVFLPNGEVGWVSSYVVRLHEGRAPEAPVVAVIPGVGGGLTTNERVYAEFHLAMVNPGVTKRLSGRVTSSATIRC